MLIQGTLWQQDQRPPSWSVQGAVLSPVTVSTFLTQHQRSNTKSLANV